MRKSTIEKLAAGGSALLLLCSATGACIPTRIYKPFQLRNALRAEAIVLAQNNLFNSGIGILDTTGGLVNILLGIPSGLRQLALSDKPYPNQPIGISTAQGIVEQFEQAASEIIITLYDITDPDLNGDKALTTINTIIAKVNEVDTILKNNWAYQCYFDPIAVDNFYQVRLDIWKLLDRAKAQVLANGG